MAGDFVGVLNKTLWWMEDMGVRGACPFMAKGLAIDWQVTPDSKVVFADVEDCTGLTGLGLVGVKQEWDWFGGWICM